MPLPRAVLWSEAVRIPGGSSLRVRHAGVTTPRIAAAVDRWLAVWEATSDGPAGRSDLQIAIADVRNRDLEIAPTGAEGRDLEIAPAAEAEFVVDCGAVGAALPALGDDERYRIEIAADRVVLGAPCEWGVLRGLATLTQLAVANGGLPGVVIDDAPRFPWRGLTLDVARHFIGIDALLATLDAMALFKLNVLHLHLTDDQGFRFPSRAFPLLASPQAYRREELERLVRHAADRGIRVVPELDMPGHTTSWLTAYPEWGCRQGEPSRRFGVHKACLDPTNPAVDAAVGTLLAEVAEVFPDRWLHIGGDEVHPEWWTTTPSVQAHMAAHGIATAADLQADFNRRVAANVAALGRRTVAWDEVLHPDLPAEVLVQSWRGATARDRALNRGHDCIVSANYYLDLFFPADVHYRFDPEAPEAALVALEDGLEEDPRLAHVAAGMRWTRHWREPGDGRAEGRPFDRTPGRVLGGEACLWSELVNEAVLHVRLWSRLPAVAERFWSPASVGESADMRRRLRGSIGVLAATGIDIVAQSANLVARAGVTDAWRPLIEQLEPVKWYARLLGADALAARLDGREMPLARPYHADTPLDRVADGLLPEAFAAWDLEHLCSDVLRGDARASLALRELARAWQALPPRGAGPAELEPLAGRLAAVGALLLDVLDGRVTRGAALETLAAAATPVGEYLLAAVPVLMRWLADGGSAGSAGGGEC
jgi:hexosaminidase